MKRSFLFTCTLTTLSLLGCVFHVNESIAEESIKTKQIQGRVLEMHMLGKAKEMVTICHFDPRYVVTVQTQNGMEKLAIHSPAKTFMNQDPVGRSYRFNLYKAGNHFLLKKIEEIDSNKTPEPTKGRIEGSRLQISKDKMN